MSCKKQPRTDTLYYMITKITKTGSPKTNGLDQKNSLKVELFSCKRDIMQFL